MFTAVQAAQKGCGHITNGLTKFTAVQAAQKDSQDGNAEKYSFTAVQAAQKLKAIEKDLGHLVHCRTGSSEKQIPRSGLPVVVHCRTGSSEKHQKKLFHER